MNDKINQGPFDIPPSFAYFIISSFHFHNLVLLSYCYFLSDPVNSSVWAHVQLELPSVIVRLYTLLKNNNADSGRPFPGNRTSTFIICIRSNSILRWGQTLRIRPSCIILLHVNSSFETNFHKSDNLSAKINYAYHLKLNEKSSIGDIYLNWVN